MTGVSFIIYPLFLNRCALQLPNLLGVFLLADKSAGYKILTALSLPDCRCPIHQAQRPINWHATKRKIASPLRSSQ
jgi:hypothetical protein